VKAKFQKYFYHPTDNGYSMVVGSSGGPGFFSGTGTRAIGPGDNCKVCDVNTAFVYMPQTVNIGPHGVVELKCFTGDAVPSDTVDSITVESEYFESPEFNYDEQFFASPVTHQVPFPWQDRESDFEVADEFVLHARNIIGNSFITRQPFFAQTVKASFSEDEFVATTWIPGVFLCYAGKDFLIAGISGIESQTVRDTALFRTPSVAGSPEYADAKPLRSPLFAFTTTSFPQVVYSHPNASTITTAQSGSSGVIVARAGAIDLLHSQLSEGEPASRELNPCDVNDRTFKQYRVAETIFSDSPYFSYDSTLRLEFIATGGSFPQLTIDSKSAISTFGSGMLNNFFQIGSVRFSRDEPIAIFSPRVDPSQFDCSPVVLRHELHDGRKTLPDEWHFAGDWPGTTDAQDDAGYSLLEAAQYTNSINYGNTSNGQLAAQVKIDSITGYDVSGLYAVGAQYERKPRKLQIRLQAFRNGTGGAMTARTDYRMVWETVVRLYRMPFRVFSATAVNGLASWTFGLEGAPELVATRSYVGHGYWFEDHDFTIAQWRSLTMSGNREVSFGGRCALQFQ
jgi:hypothetical protein